MDQWSDSRFTLFSEDSFVSGVYYKKDNGTSLQGPLKAARLCILSLLIPGILVIAPLYIRYHVYSDHRYPLAVTDMRILDQKMSTFWCQRHIVNTNATFSMPEKPTKSVKMEFVEMERHITLEDDMKEYWGFYLLNGSEVKVSTCSRWPGASIIVIKGHKHLKECAYIGDNSSEEHDEVDSSEESNNTHIPVFMRKLTSGMTVPDMAPDVVYVQHLTNEKIANLTYFKKSSKTVNHHLDYAEDLYKKEMREKIDNEDYVDKTKKAKSITPTNVVQINNIPQSKELIEESLRKLAAQGKDGAMLLQKLKEVIQNDLNNPVNETAESKNRLIEIIDDAMADDDSSWRSYRLRHYRSRFKRSDSNSKDDRENLSKELFKHDRQNDAANEEADGFSPDGIAQHHSNVIKNYSRAMHKDRSHSEFWSSFSSSEEMLLECDGLLLSLPLAPHNMCLPPNKQPDYEAASFANTVSYKDTSDGYYFFVFNSENEIQDNFIRIHFAINKTVYDVSKPISSCLNQTGECQLPLNFWSSQTTVLEMLRPGPTSESDDEFIAISTCQPRSAVYAIFLIAAPVLFVLFSFH